MLVDEGLVVREDGRWAPTRDLGRVAPRRSRRSWLPARPPASEERATIEAAAVEARSFTRIDRELTPPRRQYGGARSLVRKDLIRPGPAVFSGERACFRHLLIRDAAYESIPKQVRADLHEQHGRWLGEGWRAPVEHDEIIGYHLEQAFRYHAELGTSTRQTGSRQTRG